MAKTFKVNKIWVLVAIFTFSSCGFLTTNEDTSMKKEEVQEETIDDFTDDYVITPNYDMPLFKKLSKEFDAQEHRFEIDTCEFKYNGKSFFIGESADKLSGIFNNIIEREVETIYGDAIIFEDAILKISFWVDYKTRKIESFSIGLSDWKGEHKDTLYEIIKLRGIPYRLDMNMNEYLSLSDLDHSKLRHSTADFFILQNECAPNKTSRINTSFGSTPQFNVEGGGHLTSRGSFDPESTIQIESLSVSVKTIDDFKN